MPRDNQKRGRRAEAQKRKLEEDAATEEMDHKRPRTDDTQHPDRSAQMESQHDESAAPEIGEREFYGLLDEQEQEYFRRADDMLEANQFANPEEKSLFLANVYKEAEGKELKMACSQSCSRLLERLVLLSTPEQLKKLFQKFNGQ